MNHTVLAQIRQQIRAWLLHMRCIDFEMFQKVTKTQEL